MNVHPTPILSSHSRFLLVLAFIGFVSLGLPDGLFGVAWPSIRASFSLHLDALGALLISVAVGYVASSFASGWILARMNIGALLAWSCLATAASLIGYALAPNWTVMVACGLLAGLGAGAIDAGLNTFVATYYSARTMNLLHAFFGLGTTVGPAIMTAVLTAGHPWRLGYAIVGAAQIALAVSFALTRRHWPPATTKTEARAAAPIMGTLRLRTAQLSIATFFIYAGIEATTGVWLYSLLSEARGLTVAAAGTAVSIYWGGLLVGRLVFGLIPRPPRPEVLIRVGIAAVGLGALLLALRLGHVVTLMAAALLGFAAAPIFPALITITPRRVGEAHTANAVGFQVAAASASLSLVPALAGILANTFGLEVIPLLLLALVALLALVYWSLERYAR